MYDPSGKIQRISAGVMLPPGQCICGNGAGPELADLGVSIEWYGAMYLCEGCALAAASVFGGMTPVNETALRTRISELEQDNEKLLMEISQKEKLNDSFRSVIGDLKRSDRGSTDAPDPVRGVSVDEQPAQLINVNGADYEPEPKPIPEFDLAFSTELNDIINDDADDGEPEGVSDGAGDASDDAPGSTSEPADNARRNVGKSTGRLFGE